MPSDQVFESTRATSTPGASRRASGMLVAPERRCPPVYDVDGRWRPAGLHRLFWNAVVTSICPRFQAHVREAPFGFLLSLGRLRMALLNQDNEQEERHHDARPRMAMSRCHRRGSECWDTVLLLLVRSKRPKRDRTAMIYLDRKPYLIARLAYRGASSGRGHAYADLH